ncbi:hypothetical protein E1I18_00710 [Mycoplasmopsis mucosicanis]|uniref:Uncharacterized protein n=1 Tax=Mycoplasmopsis mucosicanis TaxID=458208 RepID=A0A507SS77_9BACT|nr:hypothetical protein [Mycoplasmopsis mucosicanis]TQC54111.1 hypothetical protein E1I18_00710 [Mycoplasmopsis mucosicanis]
MKVKTVERVSKKQEHDIVEIDGWSYCWLNSQNKFTMLLAVVVGTNKVVSIHFKKTRTLKYV